MRRPKHAEVVDLPEKVAAAVLGRSTQKLTNERLAEILEFAGFCSITSDSHHAENYFDLIGEVVRLRRSEGSK